MSQRCLHVFPLFTRRQCAKLLAYLDALPGEAPNSMNRYGAVLSDAKLQTWVDRLIAKHVAPIAKRCYGLSLAKRGHYAFLVRYEVGKQKSLAAHFDSSDVTLNVCLGKRFTGGDVAFASGAVVEHAVGRALVHHGKAIHQARKLTGGKRTNLIVWCRKR